MSPRLTDRVSGLDWHHLHTSTGTPLPDTEQTAEAISTLLDDTARMINDPTAFIGRRCAAASPTMGLAREDPGDGSWTES